jgi:hypothetical protein
MNDLLNLLLEVATTRYQYASDERSKAIQRGDKTAEMIYQTMMMEYDAQVQIYKSKLTWK